MGVIVRTTGTVVTPPPVNETPSQGRTLREDIVLHGVNDDVIRLSDPDLGLKVLADGITGFGMPTPRWEDRVTPGVDGSREGDVTYAPRDVQVTVSMRMNRARMAAMADRFAAATNPARGLIRLVATNPYTGARRQVEGRYTGGAEIGSYLQKYARWPLAIRCSREIAWTDTPDAALSGITWTLPDPRPWFPFPGWIRPASGQVIGGPQPVTNDGDLDINPDWLLHGPATSLDLRNLTTGRRLLWNGTLATGKWLTIITTPGLQQVVDSDGVSRYYQLDQVVEPDFWTLTPGLNTIQSEVDGTGEGTTFTLLPRVRRWLTAG